MAADSSETCAYIFFVISFDGKVMAMSDRSHVGGSKRAEASD